MNHNERLMRILMELRHFGNEIAPPEQLGIPSAAVRILDCIHERRASTVAEVSEALRLTPPTISVAVKKLAAAGFIARKPGDDGRSAWLELTPKGHSMRTTIQEFREVRVKRMLMPLSEPEREQLLNLLERVIASATNSQE